MSQDRLDIKYAVKEVSSWKSRPRRRDWREIVRLTKYFIFSERFARVFFCVAVQLHVHLHLQSLRSTATEAMDDKFLHRVLKRTFFSLRGVLKKDQSTEQMPAAQPTLPANPPKPHTPTSLATRTPNQTLIKPKHLGQREYPLVFAP